MRKKLKQLITQPYAGMNLFILSSNPIEAAEAHADKHVVKMILEACQMLYSAHWVAAYPNLLENKSPVAVSRAYKILANPTSMVDAPSRVGKADLESGYKPAHLHHPCTRWVRSSLQNYQWACALALAIGHEYTFRYGKIHACQQHAEWLQRNPPVLPSEGLQQFAIAMAIEYKISADPIVSYQHYYRTGKQGLLQYTKRERPLFLRD